MSGSCVSIKLAACVSEESLHTSESFCYLCVLLCTLPPSLVLSCDVRCMWCKAGSASVCGPDSSVGIATDSGDLIPVGAKFFAHVQTDPGAHPASCTMGTGSFPGVKLPGRGADHPPLPAPRLRMSRATPLLPF
jgi:hypothetical protein